MEGLGFHYPGLCGRSGGGECRQCNDSMESYRNLSPANKGFFRDVARDAVSSDLEAAWAVKKGKLAQTAQKRQEEYKSPWKQAGDNPMRGRDRRGIKNG